MQDGRKKFLATGPPSDRIEGTCGREPLEARPEEEGIETKRPGCLEHPGKLEARPEEEGIETFECGRR